MPAHIKIGALPDAKVEGKIYKIAPKSKTAEGATLFDVEIELLPAKDVVLRAGYSANAEIVVREKHDVLTDPRAPRHLRRRQGERRAARARPRRTRR